MPRPAGAAGAEGAPKAPGPGRLVARTTCVKIYRFKYIFIMWRTFSGFCKHIRVARAHNHVLALCGQNALCHLLFRISCEQRGRNLILREQV